MTSYLIEIPLALGGWIWANLAKDEKANSKLKKLLHSEKIPLAIGYPILNAFHSWWIEKGKPYGKAKPAKAHNKEPKIVVGIRVGKFPWISAISLIYPVLAAFYISTRTPASFSIVIGYSLSNLGYVMFAAGIFAGTYRIFGLTKRWQVFAGAIIAFLVGIVLSNIGV